MRRRMTGTGSSSATARLTVAWLISAAPGGQRSPKTWSLGRSPLSHFSVSIQPFWESAFGNRFWESGRVERLWLRSARRDSRHWFVFGNAYGDVSDGFDRLVIVVSAFVGSAVVQPQPNASRCAAYASAPSDIDARPVSVSLQRQASCGELNRNRPPGSSELAALVRSFCWSPSLSRKISPIEITPTNVMPKKELF